MHSKRRGQYFEIDALLAIAILIAGLVQIRNYSLYTVTNEQNKEFSIECIEILKSMRINDLPPDVLANISAVNYTYENNSLSTQIGIYMLEGRKDLAINISRTVLDGLIPSNYGYSLYIFSDDNYSIIYSNSAKEYGEEVSVSKTLITGLQNEQPYMWGPALLECRIWI